jgi:hypothetical protein
MYEAVFQRFVACFKVDISERERFGMNNPIPREKFEEFKAVMNAADYDNLPDGAWFQVLEDTAKRFMKSNKLKGCANDATHQYIRSCVNS